MTWEILTVKMVFGFHVFLTNSYQSISSVFREKFELLSKVVYWLLVDFLPIESSTQVSIDLLFLRYKVV